MKNNPAKKNIIRAYLIFAVVFGVLYMLIMPFPASPDENRHFTKIYSITEGYILPADDTVLPDGLEIPDQFDLKYDELKKDRGRIADYDNMHSYDLSRTSFYFPLVYTPQIAGFIAAKQFTRNIYTICLVGRLFGYFFNVCLICAALRTIPYGEYILFLAVFNPMYMQQAVSLSGDSVVNALAVFLTAYILALRAGKVKKTWVLYVIFPVLSICKMFYLPMALLVFLIGNKVTGSKKKTVILRCGVIAESLILSLLWVYIASRASLYIASESSGSNLDVILGDPAGYGRIIINTCISEGRTWVRQTFGGNLGWIAINLFMPFILLYLLLFIYTALAEKGDMKIYDRCVIFITDIVIFLIVLTTEYVQWTGYRGEIIDGVQGRYFLPVIPISFLGITAGKHRLPSKHLKKVIYVYTAFYNTAALWTVYRAFS